MKLFADLYLDREVAEHADRRRDPQPTPLYLSAWLLPVFVLP